jgi:UDP-N-acetylglucosamine---dolichyl-phosphate N-acetylglucosaminyltransferase
VFSHPINLGYGGAAIASCLRSGVEARADVIITFDADLQHNPKDIPFLVRPILDESPDIVTRSRFIEQNGEDETPYYRKFGICF